MPRKLNPTLKFVTEGLKIKGYSLFDLIHGLFYSKFTYQYIGIGTGNHPLSKTFQSIFAFFYAILNPNQTKRVKHSFSNNSIQFADTYHGKVVPISAAKQLVSVNKEIRIENLEHVIPYQKARDLILLEPTHIGVIDCPCRVSRKNPCLPMDVCIIVGEPFVGMILEYHPKRARKISQNEALQILEDEEARGHVHHAFFKDAMLERFYAICNCCSCCCGAMHAHQNGTPMLASSGYLAVVDEELCIGCAECMDMCQFDAISNPGNTASINFIACMGCGVCTSHCKQDAISLIPNPSKGMPLELDSLMRTIDNTY